MFIRQAEVIIGNALYKMGDIELQFSVDFDVTPDFNEATITMYNLSDTSINTIERGQQIVINAGYVNDVGAILSGFVLSAKTTWSGVDKVTEILCIDASEEYLKTSISKTYENGIFASEVLDDLLKLSGLSVGEISLPINRQYVKGITLTGDINKIIKQVANDCNTSSRIINGAITIGDVGSGVQIGFVLNSNTGLIGSPEKLDVDMSNPDVQPDYHLQCLLNHRVRTSSAFVVQSKTLNATVCVLKGSHKGSETGDYITDCEVKIV